MKMRNRKHQLWCRVVRLYEPGRSMVMQHAVFYRGGRLIKSVSRYFSRAEHEYARANPIPSQEA